MSRNIAPVPPAARKTTAAPRRAGKGWALRVVPFETEVGDEPVQLLLRSKGLRADGIVMDHERFICWWNGTTGIVVVTLEGWDRLTQSDAALDLLQEAEQEAVMSMPRAVVRHIVYATSPPPAPVRRGTPPKNSNGIKELRAQITALVEEMSSLTAPDVVQQTELARRYGALRDRMALLRKDFSEAEGAFEVAQAQIVAFMED